MEVPEEDIIWRFRDLAYDQCKEHGRATIRPRAYPHFAELILWFRSGVAEEGVRPLGRFCPGRVGGFGAVRVVVLPLIKRLDLIRKIDLSNVSL